MGYTPKRIYTGQPAVSAATLYTAPASTTTIVKEITACNTTASTAIITVNFVPSGSTQSAANQIVSSQSIRPNSSMKFTNLGYLNTGDFISAFQGTANAITLHIAAVEVS